MTKIAPPESAWTLWYYPSINRFTDENGAILGDLQPYFDTWQIDQWKRGKGYAFLTDKLGNFWELFYPEEDECSHICETCAHRCDIYDMIKDR